MPPGTGKALLWSLIIVCITKEIKVNAKNYKLHLRKKYSTRYIRKKKYRVKTAVHKDSILQFSLHWVCLNLLKLQYPILLISIVPQYVVSLPDNILLFEILADKNNKTRVFFFFFSNIHWNKTKKICDFEPELSNTGAFTLTSLPISPRIQGLISLNATK